METTSLRLFLQSLCENSQWIYAVFWKSQQGPHMLLDWADGYCDVQRSRACMTSIIDDAYSKNFNEFLSSTCEPSACIESLDGLSIGQVVAEMSTSYYAVGEGVVGEVAYKGVPQWVFSDEIANDKFNPSIVSQCADEWLPQFAAGIKTILLIPYMPDGVLQLGSFEMVAEDRQLVAIIKDEFEAYLKFAEYPSSVWLPVEVQHQSSVVMSALMENLDESFVYLRSNIGEDPRAEDLLSHAKNTSFIMPVSRHIFDQDMFKVQEFETGEEDVQLLNMIDAATRVNHQQLEQSKSEITTGVHSDFSNNNASVPRDYANEMLDFYLDGGEMQPPLNIDCGTMVTQSTGEFLSFPTDCELHKALGSNIIDSGIQYRSGFSDSIGFVTSSSMCNGDHHEDNLPEAVVTNARNTSDYISPNLRVNASPFEYPIGRFLCNSGQPNQSERGRIAGEDSGPWSCVTSEVGHGNAYTNSSASRTSAPTVTLPQGRGYDFQHPRKKSSLSTTNKRRTKPGGDYEKPRPRDRQLIQDRIKELRELVPNGAKCSIDGLLDKTIKHMMFLENITNRAEKLKQHVVKDVPERLRQTSQQGKNSGASWAVDLADEQRTCPIIVKDLESPGQMLIETLCYDYGHFLDITNVIHRLELTILRGKMDTCSDGAWAHFVVEATGSFHRLDLFWPLMQLLQQNQLNVSSKI